MPRAERHRDPLGEPREHAAVAVGQRRQRRAPGRSAPLYPSADGFPRPTGCRRTAAPPRRIVSSFDHYGNALRPGAGSSWLLHVYSPSLRGRRDQTRGGPGEKNPKLDVIRGWSGPGRRQHRRDWSASSRTCELGHPGLVTYPGPSPTHPLVVALARWWACRAGEGDGAALDAALVTGRPAREARPPRLLSYLAPA